jgi:hypothetical protein
LNGALKHALAERALVLGEIQRAAVREPDLELVLRALERDALHAAVDRGGLEVDGCARQLHAVVEVDLGLLVHDVQRHHERVVHQPHVAPDDRDRLFPVGRRARGVLERAVVALGDLVRGLQPEVFVAGDLQRAALQGEDVRDGDALVEIERLERRQHLGRDARVALEQPQMREQQAHCIRGIRRHVQGSHGAGW